MGQTSLVCLRPRLNPVTLHLTDLQFISASFPLRKQSATVSHESAILFLA